MWPFSRTLKCPFCQQRPPLTKHFDAAISENVYSCKACSSHFTLLEDGSLDAVYTARMRGGDSPSGAPSFATLDAVHSVLCRQCSNHQLTFVQLLSSFEGDTAASYELYRRQLEQRYPLCPACEFAVRERLKQIDFKIKCSRLGRRSRDSSAAVAITNKYHKNRQLGGVVDAATNGVVVSGLVCHAKGVWPLAAVTALSLVQMWLRHRSLWNVLVAVLTCGLRVSVLAGAQQGNAPAGLWVSLLLFAAPLLYMPRRGAAAAQTFYRAELEQHVALPSGKDRGKENGLNTFNSIKLGGAPGPETTRNPFEFKASVGRAPPSNKHVPLRPTRLDHCGQSIGLEDVMSSFKLDAEHGVPSRAKQDLSVALRQIFLSVCLCVMRVLGGGRVSLVAVILAASSALGGFWTAESSRVYRVITLLRLCVLVVQATSPALVPCPHPALFTAADCLLLLVR